MSLYDGLGINEQDRKPKESSDVAGWGKGIRLLQSQLQLKKATLTKHQRDKDKTKQPIIASGIPLLSTENNESSKRSSSPLVGDLKTSGKEKTFQSVFKIGQFQHVNAASNDPDSLLFNITNEYDPQYPNDYEIIKEKQRKEKEKLREAEKKQKMEEREKQRRERHERAKERDRDREKERDKDRDRDRSSNGREERERERDRGSRRRRNSTDSDSDRSSESEDENDKKKAGKGAAIAPPASLTRSAPAAIPALGSSGGKGSAIPPPPLYNDDELDTLPPGAAAAAAAAAAALKGSTFGFAPGVGANSVAAKIMKKYGFREGQGLGRNEQGMSRALEVEKTSKRGGKILSEKDLVKVPEVMPPPVLPPPPQQTSGTSSPVPPAAPSQGAAPALTELMKNPTKVVLLKNMVGPGDVDDDLQAEVTEECSNYGTVAKCLIYEIHGAPDDESVRIFVEFDNLPSAIKAIVDLNGRYFGGRLVKGAFYDPDKFKRFELSD